MSDPVTWTHLGLLTVAGGSIMGLLHKLLNNKVDKMQLKSNCDLIVEQTKEDIAEIKLQTKPIPEMRFILRQLAEKGDINITFEGQR